MFFNIIPIIVIRSTRIIAIKIDFLICPVKLNISWVNAGYLVRTSFFILTLLKICEALNSILFCTNTLYTLNTFILKYRFRKSKERKIPMIK